MHQVLFTIPILKGTFPPDGIPVYGFGAMLFVTFIVVTWWGTVRAKKIGMEPTRFQDFTIWLFISGIIGARILYMIQYANQFPSDIPGILGSFFKIWEGGIVFYGSALGGAIGYGLFYWLILRRLQVSGWQLADAVAPLLALGLAIGRIGCYLNGCCWGQVANEEVCTVPLGSAHFPLLPAHARPQLVSEQQLQTSTGFAIAPRNRGFPYEDPRALVTAVEKDSPAEKSGLKPGDRIVKVNGEPNAIVMELSGNDDMVKAAAAALEAAGAKLSTSPTGRARASFPTLEGYFKGREAAAGVDYSVMDRLEEMTSNWPRGKAQLKFSVERPTPDGPPQTVELPAFSPRTIGLYPTQLYETVSMVLLILFLLAYYPYRHHDGELMVLVMIGYAIHRFINESLRIEPSYTGGLTLSQWGSVVVLAAAIGIETFLWCTMPSRWKGEPQAVPPAPQATPPVQTA
jgi:phosphatidylglycerol---prolipoprotein diacylglyceryl transferase